MTAKLPKHCYGSMNQNPFSQDYMIGEKLTDTDTGVQWEIRKFLGKGAFSRVYSLTVPGNQGKAVGKLLLRKKVKEETFEQEVAFLSMMNHPNIVRLIRTFEHDLHYVIIMENCCKTSLHEYISRSKRTVPFEQITNVTRQVANAIKYIHDLNVVHRDISLGNILFNKRWHVQICDFGLSTKMLARNARCYETVGTPNFVAPELLPDSKAGHSFPVDIWSLGVVVHAMITGTPPFETREKRVEITFRLIRTRQYQMPEDIPDATKQLIDAMLQFEDKRPTIDTLLQFPFFDDAPQSNE